MKKLSMFLFIVMLAIGAKSFAQTTPSADFFAGKWEILITGTPNGDSKFLTELVRKDGKLTGELKDPTGAKTEATPITKIDESANTITIYFDTAQAGEIGIELNKVDDDNLKGSLMSMFDASASRIK